jgi:hypothetical protein
MLHTDSSVIPGWAMGSLEVAVPRGIVVPHNNNYENENSVLKCCDERPREALSQELFSGCILLTRLTQGQMCAEGGRGNTLHSVPSAFASSREDSVQLRATTSFVTRVVKLVLSIQTQMLRVLNLATRREEVCECASRSMHY